MDFNQIINRNNTGSVKWDFIERHFGDGAGKLLPMWVSDFDFACPPEVQVEQATEHLPWARIVPAQGTYLLWMDCKKLGLDDEQLKWVMADVAGIAPSMGSGFGPAGSGFIRLNLGCSRTYLEMAIDGLKRISVKTIKGIPTGG
ncbi:hypothetical protein EX399_01430 [Salmonella enterica]|nr:hypothetical protein [Salmonella enterica]